MSLAIDGDLAKLKNLRAWEAELAVAAEARYTFVEEEAMGEELKAVPEFQELLERYPARGGPVTQAVVAATAAAAKQKAAAGEGRRRKRRRT